MPNNPIPQKVLAWARNTGTRTLVIIGLVVSLIVGGGIALTMWATAPTYTVLFSGLTGTDAGAITAKLDADGTPYKLGAGGSTIMVPQDVVDTTRIAMATAALPASSTVGYELLDNQSITTDSFTQQVNYQRAKEGELAKTIQSIQGISKARVSLVLPQERLFSEQETPARASVQLTTTGAVTEDKVAAMTHLVASSVANLDPSNVTVVDQNARLLSGGGTAGGTGSGDQRKAQAAYEATLEQQATTMLAKVTGEDKAVVRVNATMDFTQRTRATEEYDPKKSAAKETSSSKEQYSTTTTTPGGTLTANPAQPNQNNQTKTDQQYSKTADAQALNNTKTITQEVEAPGAVKRLTVSVLLDSKAAGSMNSQQVQSLVSNAIGIDTTRGDTVVVDQAPFDTSATTAPAAADKAAAEKEKAAQKNKLMVFGGAGVLFLLALVVLLILGLRSRKTPIDDSALAAMSAAAATVPALEDATPITPAARRPMTVPNAGNEAAAVLSSVEQRPEDAARVLRGMVAGDSVRGGSAQ